MIARNRLVCPNPKCNSTLAERIKTSSSGHQRFLACYKCQFIAPKADALKASREKIVQAVKGAKVSPRPGQMGEVFYLHPDREKVYTIKVYPSRATGGTWTIGDCTCPGFSSHSHCKHADLIDLMFNAGEPSAVTNQERALEIWNEEACSRCKGSGQMLIPDHDMGSLLVNCSRLCYLNHRKPAVDVTALLAS